MQFHEGSSIRFSTGWQIAVRAMANQNRANHHCAAKTTQWVDAHFE